jgi:hypothetical protein
VDELQAGVEEALAVLPQAAAFFQPREGALDHPTLGITANVCNSLRLAICTVAPSISSTACAKGWPT